MRSRTRLIPLTLVQHATEHAATVYDKSWNYLVIPHDEIVESTILTGYLRFERKP